MAKKTEKSGIFFENIFLRFLNVAAITVFTFNFSAFEGSAAQRPKIVKIN
ncbi:MAG: hypothetical protein LBS83_01615 [Holosporales bacterium]|jgi:hypothetical protein|nr:hypothetical protein [Holosporales bacterium]